MFDPFKDFDVNGYLRNVRKDKDEDVIKQFEHNLFRANLEEALSFLASKKYLEYTDFLSVHKILFSAYYPWAGTDRSVTMPNHAVVKGPVIFCHPNYSRRAVEFALSIGQNKLEMEKRPGEVMGLFAYGHPFLDGNGRTMLLVHMELAYRAGFSTAWADTKKNDYLDALSREIESPGRGILDEYLLAFKGPRANRDKWGTSLRAMKGLDGLDDMNQIEGVLSDPSVAQKYRDFEQKRNYQYKVLKSDPRPQIGSMELCQQCKKAPCECGRHTESSTTRPRM